MDGGDMNIDERLEALTHSVELLAGMQIETEKRMGQLAESMAQLTNRTSRLEESMVTLVDGMTLLTRIALDHTERIDNLEGNRPQQ
jgi:hypothetical protein